MIFSPDTDLNFEIGLVTHPNYCKHAMLKIHIKHKKNDTLGLLGDIWPIKVIQFRQ